MKKVIALLLALMMLFTIVTPVASVAYAADDNSAAVSTVEEQDRVIRRKWNLFNEFTIYIKSLKSIDGNKTLNRIKQRIKNNEVNNEDIADLETIIFIAYFYNHNWNKFVN